VEQSALNSFSRRINAAGENGFKEKQDCMIYFFHDPFKRIRKEAPFLFD
jgi:hypothetical protein